MDNITISIEDLKAVITSVISDEKIDKMTAKPQLTTREAYELYGEVRIRKFIKSGLLKPVSQNGKNSKKYYSHKKIIELVNKFFHHLKDVKL